MSAPGEGQGFQGAKFHVNKFNVLQIIVQIILMKKGILTDIAQPYPGEI